MPVVVLCNGFYRQYGRLMEETPDKIIIRTKADRAAANQAIHSFGQQVF